MPYNLTDILNAAKEVLNPLGLRFWLLFSFFWIMVVIVTINNVGMENENMERYGRHFDGKEYISDNPEANDFAQDYYDKNVYVKIPCCTLLLFLIMVIYHLRGGGL